MPLPYPGQSVSPFDVITAQFTNETIANIEALADGSGLDDDVITASKIDFGGSGSGIWWEELGRTTLGTAGDAITVSSLPARKYLQVIFSVDDTGGTISPWIRFNNDSSGNYYFIYSVTFGSPTGLASQSGISLNPGAAANEMSGEASITNVSSAEKIVNGLGISRGGSGPTSAPSDIKIFGKWTNTSNLISSVSIYNSGGTGDFAIGSELIVLGHD